MDPGHYIAFDKDDEDTLDFVLATANLRATAYGIPTKTRFDVKGTSRLLIIRLQSDLPFLYVQKWLVTSFPPSQQPMPSLQDIL